MRDDSTYRPHYLGGFSLPPKDTVHEQGVLRWYPGRESPIPWHGALEATPGYVYTLILDHLRVRETYGPLCSECIVTERYRHTEAHITWVKVETDVLDALVDCVMCRQVIARAVETGG